MTRSLAILAAIALIVAACSSDSTSPSVSPTAPALSPATSPTPAPAASPTRPANPSWERLTTGGDVPAPREDHTWTVDAASGIAWLFGGRDRGTLFGDLWSYDLATGRWTQVEPSGDAPAARFGHTGTWVDGVGLVVWSGQSGGDFFADIHAYDPATNAWARLPDAGAVPEARYGSCAALGPDGRLWISHGFTFAGRFADTRGYDFAQRAWIEMTPEEAGPVKRCLHDCLWSQNGRLILYAGQTDGVAALGDLWTFDIGFGWTEAAAPEPPARQLYALASTGPTGWVFGGRGADGKTLDDLWTLDLETITWQQVPAAGDGPEGRAGATLVADPARSRLLLFGGVGAAALADTWQLANVNGR
jgi:hypothetical protein